MRTDLSEAIKHHGSRHRTVTNPSMMLGTPPCTAHRQNLVVTRRFCVALPKERIRLDLPPPRSGEARWGLAVLPECLGREPAAPSLSPPNGGGDASGRSRLPQARMISVTRSALVAALPRCEDPRLTSKTRRDPARSGNSGCLPPPGARKPGDFRRFPAAPTSRPANSTVRSAAGRIPHNPAALRQLAPPPGILNKVMHVETMAARKAVAHGTRSRPAT
jgi:hypothetical protein